MSWISLMLLIFVGLGLTRNRLGQAATYIIMGFVIVVYVAYAYHRPQ